MDFDFDPLDAQAFADAFDPFDLDDVNINAQVLDNLNMRDVLVMSAIATAIMESSLLWYWLFYDSNTTANITEYSEEITPTPSDL
ncbi:hypothetical protein Fsol_00358 [Candidatus Fokinia solitaria]|uniref:Uncharacterized protein n=2 Tax=Candidatus Fokinia solitaria TaxID=1802984 RepID=A0A2U8BS19_9RICK|nr:hypothetical protein Fsol_00358 [Candidatus Fokinia solitaria]